MTGLLEERARQARGTSAEIGADNEPLGLLGDVEVLGNDADIEAEVVETSESFESIENIEASDSIENIETSEIGEASEITEASKACESTYTWTYANGRRYASSELGHYFMPNDEPEVQRLNEQHRIFTQVKGGSLHFAPLPTKSHSARVLDIGCGSGIWCIEMAEDYPHARIHGMDVSPIQPQSKPANVSWLTQDMEADWPFPDNYFDLIHLSLVHGCVDDWDAFLAKIKRHLAPGGYVEHQELSLCRQYAVDEHGQRIPMADNDIDALPPFFRWTRLMEQAARKRGRALQLGPELAAMQRSAGLQSVTEAVFAHKWGSWPADAQERELGTRTMLQTIAGMDGFTTSLFTQALGWSTADTQKFLLAVKRDMRDDGLRKVMDLHVVHGQKPVGPSRSPPHLHASTGGSSRVAGALADSPGMQLGARVVVAAIGVSFAAAFVHWVLLRQK